MLSFTQFVAESKGIFDENHWGFLRHGKKPLVNKRLFRHDMLAAKHGFRSSDDAVKQGLVRFHHYHPEKPAKDIASYEYVDSPKTRNLVSRHLGRSGGFQGIDLSVHHPGNKETTHTFRSVEDARKHLDS